MRRFLTAAVALALVMVVAPFIGPASDAADAEWRDPPTADHVITITQDFVFKSNDPAYSFGFSGERLPLGSTFAGTDDHEGVRQLLMGLRDVSIDKGRIVDEKSVEIGKGYTDACLPSWIFVDFHTLGGSAVTNPSGAGWTLTICPAQQALEHDTHGDYWIYYDIIRTPTSAPEIETTYLIVFDVDVEWNGGVIVPVEYNQFELVFDYGLGGAGNHSILRTVGSDVLSYTFDIPAGQVPDNDGFRFAGWSVGGGVHSGSTLTVHSDDPFVIVTGDGSGGTHYKVVMEAVWEQEKVVIPTLFDGLIELLSDPVVLVVGFLLIMGMAAFIRSRSGYR